MKKIYHFFAFSLIAFVLFEHSTPMSALTDTELLSLQAQMEYQKYKSLKYHFDLTHSKEDAHEFCQWKSQFADILNYTKENQSIENFLIFFSHFMNCMYEIDLKNAEYQHCKIDFIPPDQVTLTGSIVVTLIDIYESADIRIIF